MRILTNDYPMNLPGSQVPMKGGPQRFARDFSAYAVAKGHEWHGVLNFDPNDERIAGLPLEAPGKKFYFIESATISYDQFKNYDGSVPLEELFAHERKRMEEIFDDVRPDIVYVNGHSVFTWVLGSVAAERGIPVVLAYHGIWKKEMDAYAGIFSEESRKVCEQMERWFAAHANVNIFLNQSSLDAFRQALPGVTLKNPQIIPLPHAGWPFSGAYAPQAKTERVIGAVARWDRIKNHAAILAVAEEIHRRALPWKVRVVTIIPDTPAHAAFKARYRELIEVVPTMDREALREFYREADAFILPSHFETVGGVVMEALAEGKPTLISPHVGWVSEYRECGMDSWIADFDDPRRAVDSLETQFARESWPEVARFAAFVSAEHAPEKVFPQYEELFSNLIR